MAIRRDLCTEREAVAERRARVLELTRRGWRAYEIAYELRISERTVQRYRDNERAGRPAGQPIANRITLERAPMIVTLHAEGLRPSQIAGRVGVSSRTVRRYLARAS